MISFSFILFQIKMLAFLLLEKRSFATKLFSPLSQFKKLSSPSSFPPTSRALITIMTPEIAFPASFTMGCARVCVVFLHTQKLVPQLAFITYFTGIEGLKNLPPIFLLASPNYYFLKVSRRRPKILTILSVPPSEFFGQTNFFGGGNLCSVKQRHVCLCGKVGEEGSLDLPHIAVWQLLPLLARHTIR